MNCDKCFGRGYLHDGNAWGECVACGGYGVIHCCDGPVGYVDELVNEPSTDTDT